MFTSTPWDCSTFSELSKMKKMRRFFAFFSPLPLGYVSSRITRFHTTYIYVEAFRVSDLDGAVGLGVPKTSQRS